MSTHRNIDKICLAVLVLTLILTVVFMNGEKLGIRVITSEDSESGSSSYFTENDLDGDWDDNAYTTYITLSGSGGKIKGNGAYFLDGNLVISNGGWYVISGTLDDGKIVVDAKSSSKIWIRLNGVTLHCSDDACIRVDQADKVFLTLAEGSENTVSSGSTYSDEALSDNTGGAIFSHDDLTINGSGSLSVTAEYKHGIDANDSLVITGGEITITAPQDGIHVNDSLRFTAASLTIDAGDDAVHSDDELYVESGTMLVNSCVEGLEALTIDIVGGDITIYSTDDGLNANGGSGNNGMGGAPGGAGNGMSMPPQMSGASGSMSPPEMSGASMSMPERTAEGNKENEASAASGTADSIENTQSSAAAETTASSDTTSSSEETYIRISGGTITVINDTGNDADGLDSNGSIYIDGGEIFVSLRGEGSNSALDYGSESGGELVVTGGTVLAFGASSMAEEFSENSTQCAVLYNLDSTIEAETTFQVLDANGGVILSYTPTNSYSSVSFSSPDLTLGETYTLVSGETSVEITLESVSTTSGSSTGRMGGGKGGSPPSHSQGGASASSATSQEVASASVATSQEGVASNRPSLPNAAESNSSEMGAGQTASASASDTTEETQTTASSAVSLDELDRSVWILLGGSVLLLVAGILFAKKYRR